MNIILGYPTPQKDYYKVYVRSNTYNQAPYIDDCLNGVAMQETSFPFIHHVIDDASTDGEQDVIKAWIKKNCDVEHAEYYDNDICTITLAKNRNNPNCTLAAYFLKKNMFGNPKKRELYISWQEVCPYEALCEGDDYWIDSKKLQKQVDLLEANPHCMLCFTRAKVTNTSRLKNARFFLDTASDKNYTPTELLEKWIVPTASIIFRKNILDFPIKGEERFISGDIKLYLRAAAIGDVYGMSDYTCVYNFNDEGLSVNPKYYVDRQLKYPDQYICILENFKNIHKKAVQDKIFGYCVDRYNLRQNKWEKIKELMIMFRYCPKQTYPWFIRRVHLKSWLKNLLNFWRHLFY